MICFSHNPTGWDLEAGAPVPGGMSATHIDPVTAWLPGDTWCATGKPLANPDVVNVWYTFRRVYFPHERPMRRRREAAAKAHVFAGHGIADKNWRNPDKVARFGFVASTGPTWTARYVDGGIDRARILEVGYPKLDPILTDTVPSPWPPRDGRIRVLWAPTHGGGGETHIHRDPRPGRTSASTHWRHADVLAPLHPDRFDVRAALHPRHRPDRRATLAEYVGADVVIADGGSTIYEAWAVGLPVVFPTWLVGERNLGRAAMEADIYHGRVGRHAARPADLPHLVTAAAADGITRDEEKFLEPVWPRALRDGESGRRFADALAAINDGQTPSGC